MLMLLSYYTMGVTDEVQNIRKNREKNNVK